VCSKCVTSSTMGQRSPPRESSPLTQQEEGGHGCCLEHIKVYARLAGVLTVAAMWVSAVVMIQDKDLRDGQWLPWYLLAAAIVVTIFELLWIINKCACCAKDGACCTCWSVLLWLDNWKRFLLYVLMAVPMFLRGFSMPLGLLCGSMLIITANLYMIKTFYAPKSARTPKIVVTTKTPNISMVTTNVSTQTDLQKYKLDSKHTTTVDLTSTSDTATLTSNLEGTPFDGDDLTQSVATGESYMFID